MERSWFGELLIEKCLHWTIEGGWEGTENLLEPSIPRGVSQALWKCQVLFA